MRLSVSFMFCYAAMTGVLQAEEQWTATLTGNFGASPAYQGSKDLALFALPGVGFHKAGSDPGFSAPDDNISLALFDQGWLKAGPVGHFQSARRAQDHSELHGLKDVPWTLEAGAFVEAWATPKLRARVEVMQGFHGHHGVVANASLDYVEKLGKWTLSAGPRLTLADRHAMSKLFSVSASEAAANGTFTPFEAKASLESVGFAGAATYQWNKQWNTTVYSRYDRLTQSAAHSPITVQTGSRNQLTFGAAVSYSFDFNRFW